MEKPFVTFHVRLKFAKCSNEDGKRNFECHMEDDAGQWIIGFSMNGVGGSGKQMDLLIYGMTLDDFNYDFPKI